MKERKGMNIPKKSNGTPIMWSERYIQQAVDLACGDDGSRSKEVLSILERLWNDNNNKARNET